MRTRRWFSRYRSSSRSSVFTCNSSSFLPSTSCLAKRFDRYASGRHFLGDENGKCLRAFLVPVVQARENRVLVVEIVVEDGDLRRAESELLREGPRAFDAQVNRGGRAVETDRRRSLLGSLRGPLVTRRRAIGMKFERAGNVRCALRRLHFRRAARNPIGAALADFEFFLARLLPTHQDAEFSLVGSERGAGLDAPEEATFRARFDAATETSSAAATATSRERAPLQQAERGISGCAIMQSPAGKFRAPESVRPRAQARRCCPRDNRPIRKPAAAPDTGGGSSPRREKADGR